jgi:hypothetical protein
MTLAPSRSAINQQLEAAARPGHTARELGTQGTSRTGGSKPPGLGPLEGSPPLDTLRRLDPSLTEVPDLRGADRVDLRVPADKYQRVDYWTCCPTSATATGALGVVPALHTIRQPSRITRPTRGRTVTPQAYRDASSRNHRGSCSFHNVSLLRVFYTTIYIIWNVMLS